MSKQAEYLIVIPCYNEAAKWPSQAYTDFLQDCPDYLEFLFVNDGSTDDTASIIDSLAEQFPDRVSNLQMKKNSGKAEAVRQGMLLAQTQSEYKYVGYFDADLATPLSEIDHLISFISKKKEPVIIMGSRVKIMGTTNIQRNPMRHYIGRVVATFISKVLRLGIYDTQCGAKLIKGADAKKLLTDKFMSRWLFDVELLFRVLKLYPDVNADKMIIEVPLNTWIEKGASKVHWTFAFRIPYELLRMRFKYR